MIKKTLLLLSLSCLMSFQAMVAFEYSEQELQGFIDLDPARLDESAKVPHLKVLDKELEEALSSSSDHQDPKKAFEQIIQHQNQEYISSLGLSR